MGKFEILCVTMGQTEKRKISYCCGAYAREYRSYSRSDAGYRSK